MSNPETGQSDVIGDSHETNEILSYKDKYFAYLSEEVGPHFTAADIHNYAFSWPGAPFVEGVYENAYIAYINELAQQYSQLSE
jgi:hypothetical protein